MSDPNIGQVAASTLRNRDSEVFDAITNNNGLLAYMKKKGQFKTKTGGRTFVVPITFAENNNAKWHGGGLDSWVITAQSTLDASEWNRKHQAGFIYVTEAERMANRGEAQVVEIVKHKIDVLKSTLANDFSTALYNDGSDSTQIVGLQALVADTPTNTVGGISGTTYSWWKNTTSSGTTSTASNIEAQLDAAWLSTIRGTDHPTLLVGGNNMFTYWKNNLGALQRLTSKDNADGLDFQSLMYQSVPFIFDPTCNTKRVYGLDLSDLELICDAGNKWMVGDSQRVPGTSYDVAPVSWSGAFVCKRRQSHFVLNGT